jgi:glycosyltransferase involved in cell wall biosynthesis
MIRIVKNSSDYCVSVSEEGAHWIKNVAGVSSEVIPNGAPFSSFKYTSEKDSEQIKILFVGRLLPKKGAAESIEIFNKALKRLSSPYIGGSTTLEIIGDGPEFETVNQMAISSLNRIVVHGKRSHDEILQIMSKSHIFIYPSTYPEGLPTVILEASANAMAVLVYEGLPGMEVAAMRHAVEICPRGNMEDHLIRLLTSRDEIYHLGQRALKHVTENHNWENLGAQFLDLEAK